MISCEELNRYLDGRLQGSGRVAFDSHLESCEGCRSALADWKKVETGAQQFLDTWEAHASKPFAKTRLVERARAEGRYRVPIKMLDFASAVAVVLVALILVYALWIPRRADVTPQPEPSVVRPLAHRVLVDEGVGFEPGGSIVGAIAEAPADGRLLVELGGARVGIAGSGKAEFLRADQDEIRIRLLRGAIAAAVNARSPGSAFAVEASGYTVEVRGTHFGVTWVEPDTLEVAVAEGVVAVSGPGGLGRKVRVGERLRADAAGDRLDLLDEEQRRALDDLVSVAASESRAPEVALPEGRAEIPDSTAIPGLSETDAPPAQPKPAPHPNPAQTEHLGAWRAWVLEGRYTDAEQALTRHLDASPKDNEAWMLLASCLRKSGQPKRSLAAYQNVIDGAGPSMAGRARYLAASLAQDKLGDHGRAEQLLTAFLKDVKGSKSLRADAKVRLARAWIAMGRRAEARRLLAEIMERHRGSAAAAQAGQLLDELGSP